MNSGAQRSCMPRDQAKGFIKLPMILIHLNLKISIEEKGSGLVSVEFIVTGSFFSLLAFFFLTWALPEFLEGPAPPKGSTGLHNAVRMNSSSDFRLQGYLWKTKGRKSCSKISAIQRRGQMRVKGKSGLKSYSSSGNVEIKSKKKETKLALNWRFAAGVGSQFTIARDLTLDVESRHTRGG